MVEELQQQEPALVEGEIVSSGKIETDVDEDDEELDIFEIIEELPCDKVVDQPEKDADATSTTECESSDGTESRPSISHEFSLSSIGSALAGLQASTADGVEKLRQSFSQIQVSPRDLNQLSEHSSRGFGGRRPTIELSSRGIGGRRAKRQSKVDFGEFEYKAVRLQYTKEDIFNIANDPKQMEELRLALRSLGAVTDTILKQKLHWYVKNSKRVRREAEERARQREEEMARKAEEERAQQLADSQLEPATPPTEFKVIDGKKVLQEAAGALSTEDPSPKTVRGIFVVQG